jgi:CRISPR-associated protein Cmr2
MSHVFGIFQIGPVQEFITCAKKTQDFWSGSYLISYLTCVAMHEVVKVSGKDAIIYPNLDQQPLYGYVAKLEQDGKPWEQPPLGNALKPTVPNRFVARLDDGNAKTLLDQSESKVNEVFLNITGHIQSEFWNKVKDASLDQAIWKQIWQRQTEKAVFDIYWIISPLDESDPESYKKSYQEAEAVFGARKAIRNFSQPDPEPGYKCTLCGEREPLHAILNGSQVRDTLKAFWKRVRQGTGQRFRDGEHLCAICTTKRLVPDWVFRQEHHIPSTSSMSAADFVLGVVQKYREDPTGFQDGGADVVADFASKARAAAEAADQAITVKALPNLQPFAGANATLAQLLTLDGDWFLKETYQNLETTPPEDTPLTSLVQNERDQARAAVRGARKALEELIARTRAVKKDPALRPFKYYAVLAMDGDDMGSRVSGAGSVNGHRILSHGVAKFAGVTAPGIIEEVYLGKVIYFGGDEGVAFVSLEHLLLAMDACRKEFAKLPAVNTTVCIGAVIAHHQQGLLSVLGEAQAALKRAKKLDGKNAFCLSIMKRSGGTTRTQAHWTYGKESARFDVIKLVEQLIEHERAGRLSDRWWRQLAAEAWGFRHVHARGGVTVDLELVFPEIERLVTRHVSRDPGKVISLSARASLIKSLQDLVRVLSPDWDAFMGLMEAATYIARGGGR